MSDDPLRKLLAQVHKRLSQAGSIDAEAREALTTVMHDIERILARKADTPAPQPRLEALAIKFQAEHPALADVLRQLADLLGKAGI
jgi:hypothetical protein